MILLRFTARVFGSVGHQGLPAGPCSGRRSLVSAMEWVYTGPFAVSLSL